MLKSLIGGLAQIAAKPQVLAAGIIAAAVQAVILLLAMDPLASVFESAVLLGQMPNVGLIELPFQFYRMYFNELNVVLLALVCALIVQFWLAVVLARFAANSKAGKHGISEALGFGVSGIGKIIGAIVFLIAVSGVFFASLQIALWLSEFNALASAVLVALLALLVAYLYVKLSFFPVIMGCKAENAKNSLIAAWDFSKEKFWRIVLLFVIVSVIAGLVEFAGSALSDAFGEGIAATVIFALFAVLAQVFSGLVLANYYLSRETGHEKLYYDTAGGRHRKRKN